MHTASLDARYFNTRPVCSMDATVKALQAAADSWYPRLAIYVAICNDVSRVVSIRCCQVPG